MGCEQLTGFRILVVEDEFYLADDAREILSDVGAEVVGPVATTREAGELIEGGPAIDAVLLDVNLGGELAFGLADTLDARGIPFAFVTGYDQAALPPRFSDRPRLQKPVNRQELVRLVLGIADVKLPLTEG